MDIQSGRCPGSGHPKQTSGECSYTSFPTEPEVFEAHDHQAKHARQPQESLPAADERDR
jgi:hypothetical protein